MNYSRAIKTAVSTWTIGFWLLIVQYTGIIILYAYVRHRNALNTL